MRSVAVTMLAIALAGALPVGVGSQVTTFVPPAVPEPPIPAAERAASRRDSLPPMRLSDLKAWVDSATLSTFKPSVLRSADSLAVDAIPRDSAGVDSRRPESAKSRVAPGDTIRVGAPTVTRDTLRPPAAPRDSSRGRAPP